MHNRELEPLPEIRSVTLHMLLIVLIRCLEKVLTLQDIIERTDLFAHNFRLRGNRLDFAQRPNICQGLCDRLSKIMMPWLIESREVFAFVDFM